MSEHPPLVARIYEAWVVLTWMITGLIAYADGELDAGFGIAVLIMLALCLSVTRRRSKLARWALTLLAALSLLSALSGGQLSLAQPSAENLFADVALLVDLAILWSPAMTRWLDSRPRSQRTGEVVSGCVIVVLLAFAMFAALSTIGLWPA